jgi:acetoin utilization protein AcuB
MHVKDRMSSPAITITPNTQFQHALELIRDHHCRRLPVVDDAGNLVGIVSEHDLLHVTPSPITSLSAWELNYLHGRIHVQEIMTQDVVTTMPDTPLGDAVLLMAEHKIGGLPVVNEDDRVVGVITETDVFKAFVEMLGGGHPGARPA